VRKYPWCFIDSTPTSFIQLGCPLHATRPKANAAFWRKKISANRTRDRLVTRTLRRRGWRVLRVWEHELKRNNEHKLVRRLLMHLGRSA